MARRALAYFTTMFVVIVASIGWAVAAPVPASASAIQGPIQAPGGACSVEEWQANFKSCVSRLQAVASNRVQCLDPPTPSTPDSGLAGWFADQPKAANGLGAEGKYTQYGYAGYSYSTYDDGGCTSAVTSADDRFETTVANGEFMISTAVIGASNALRERAWDPQSLWGWADPLVSQATKAVYEKVFSVFGVITLAVIGLYLIWRSRQADMGAATTTVGWAILIMVIVTAVAAWPVRAANLADQSLITGLSAVHDAVGPRPQNTPPSQCDDPTPGACDDNRPPALRASDTATETILYRNYLRGLLGSADSPTAQKYGLALYDARSFSWQEEATINADPNMRAALINQKNEQWEKVAEQIRTEDPEAYEYLQGQNGMDRIGAGFISILSAIMFAMFDATASVLVLLGFLIFRWAVIAAPILGTVGMLRPASAGIRRLGNAVIAAIFNIVIFGTGAAVYLFAVDLIMNTATLPGWLQVVLVWLCGVVGWLLLRPYRRITQLGGKDGTREIVSAGSWHRRFFRDVREAAKLEIAEGGGTREPVIGRNGRTVYVDQSNLRPEARFEDPSHNGATVSRELTSTSRELTSTGSRPTGSSSPARSDGSESLREREAAPALDAPSQRSLPGPARRGASTWTEPDVAERPASYAIYRPETGETIREPAQPRVRSEAK